MSESDVSCNIMIRIISLTLEVNNFCKHDNRGHL